MMFAYILPSNDPGANVRPIIPQRILRISMLLSLHRSLGGFFRRSNWDLNFSQGSSSSTRGVNQT